MQEITDSSIPDGGTVEYRLITPPPPLPAPRFILPPRYYDHILSKTLKLKMTTVEVVNQPARKMFSRGLLRPG